MCKGQDASREGPSRISTNACALAVAVCPTTGCPSCSCSALCSDSCVIRVGLSVSCRQCRLCPGPRKVKQILPLAVGFGVGSRKDCLFGILPELLCFRHERPPCCTRRSIIALRSVAEPN